MSLFFTKKEVLLYAYYNNQKLQPHIRGGYKLLIICTLQKKRSNYNIVDVIA